MGALTVAGALYVWAATTSGTLFGHHERGVYGQLADAFRHGQLQLRQAPPPGLEKVPDPYDPSQNVGFRTPQTTDLSYYGGHFYAYWGPVPALLLYLPAQAVGIELSDELVALLLALVGLLAWAAVVHLILQRLPRPPPGWMEPLALLALAAGDYVPFLLRLARVYEIAILSGVCFAGLGTLALLLALRAPRLPLPALAAASAAFGLAFASRASLIALAAPLAGVVVLARRREPNAGRARLASLAAAVAVPFGVCVLAYAIYNRQRFGSFTDFGLRYQLSSFDLHDRAYFRVGDLIGGIAAYIGTPVRVVAQFPFVWPQVARVSVPNGFYVEERAGLLAVAPLVLCLPAAWWARDRGLWAIVAALTAAAATVAAVTAVAVAGTPVRYTADFAPALLAGAVIAWCAVGARRGRAARRWRRAGAALATLTIVTSVLLSMSVEEAFLRGKPGQFRSLERAFSFVPRGAALFADHPILVGIDHRPLPDRDALPRNDFDAVPQVVMTVASPRRRQVAVAYRVRTAFTTVEAPTRMVVEADGEGPVSGPFGDASGGVRVLVGSGITHIAIRTPTGRPVVFEDVRMRLRCPDGTPLERCRSG